MTAQPVQLHSWPGRGDVGRLRPRLRTMHVDRFGDRGGLVLVAAAERDAAPERWGLGVALAVVGPVVVRAWLIVGDGAGRAARLDPDRLGMLRAWTAGQTVDTPAGPVALDVVTRRAFCDPDTGPILRAYTGGGWLVAADEGRSLGLLGEAPPPGPDGTPRPWPAARGRFGGGFTIPLPGWGAYGTRTDARGRERWGWQAALHRPPLRVKALGAHGLAAEWSRAGRGGRGPDGEPAGHWERGRPFLGRIVDLIGPAHALDGLDTGDLSDHLGAFGLAPVDVPAAVPLDAEGASLVLDIARAVHALAVALDDEAARWLTTAEDRRDGRAVVGLTGLYSPGSLATRTLRRAGVAPALVRFDTPDDAALDQWTAASHGGWTTADVQGQLVPVGDVDVRSAYPAAWSLLGCWRTLTARYLREQDATEDVRALAEQAAAGDLAPLYDPSTYRRLGLTLCMVLPDGEPWPVERPGPHGPTFDVEWFRSPVPFPFTWPDVILAAVLSGRLPRVLSATRLVPYGTPDGLRALPLRDGVTVPAGEDPVPALVRLRPPKGTDDRLRSAIRGVANPLAWGIFARLDQYRSGGILRERPSADTWPPIAATVPALVRLWLGMVQRQVDDLGGRIINRDTDGLAILASPEGGKVAVPDEAVARVLAWEQVDDVLAGFDRLDPHGDGGAFWSTDRGTLDRPLHLLSLGPKRYVLAQPDGAGQGDPPGHGVPPGLTETGGTEHSLGGGVVDPPALAGRDDDGRHAWTRPVAQYALDAATGPDPGWSAPWDAPGTPPFPVLRRFSAGSPDALAELPPELGAHPFAPLIEGEPDKLYGDPGAPLALDPGTDLAGWGRLAWVDGDGAPVRVGTTPGPRVDVVLRCLDEYAHRWTRPLRQVPAGIVDFDPRLLRRVGRGGALIDARLADLGAREEDHQVVYDHGDAPAYVIDVARAMGPRPFAGAFGLPLTTVTYWVQGERRPDADSVAHVLALLAAGTVALGTCPTCGGDVWRPGAVYCTSACRATARKCRQRQQSRAPVAGCAFPGCTEAARMRSETCSERHRKGLARRRAPDGAVLNLETVELFSQVQSAGMVDPVLAKDGRGLVLDPAPTRALGELVLAGAELVAAVR